MDHDVEQRRIIAMSSLNNAIATLSDSDPENDALLQAHGWSRRATLLLAKEFSDLCSRIAQGQLPGPWDTLNTSKWFDDLGVSFLADNLIEATHEACEDWNALVRAIHRT
jgi:hypothetical protein